MTVARSTASPGFTFTRVTVPAKRRLHAQQRLLNASRVELLLARSAAAFSDVPSISNQLLFAFHALFGEIDRDVRRAAVELEQHLALRHVLTLDGTVHRHDDPAPNGATLALAAGRSPAGSGSTIPYAVT